MKIPVQFLEEAKAASSDCPFEAGKQVGMMMVDARRRWVARRPRLATAIPPPFAIPLALLAIPLRLRRFKRQMCIV